jgi:hypothetical protein
MGLGDLFPEDEQNIFGLGGLLALAPVVFAAAHANEAGRLQILEQRSLEKWTPTLLTPPEMNEMVRRGLLDHDNYLREARRAGLSIDRAERLLSTARALLAPGELSELTRRGVMSPEEMRDYLRSLGYDDTDIERIAGLRFYIPSAQDVVSFANRDVYYPDVVEAYGMDKDFPEAMIPDMERAGMNRETALKYWEAHWQLPSMQQAFEMLQRDGETGLTSADINRLMRSAGVEPYWRDKLLAISYSPFTRVDIRRMHKLGILNRGQVVRAYRDIGYNTERAESLAQFTEKLNAQDTDDATKPFRNKFRTHVESLYLDGVLSDPELEEHFNLLAFTSKEADAFMAEARMLKHHAARKVVRSAVQKAYEGGHLSAADATARLVADGYSNDQASEIMQPWHVVRELRELSAHEHAARDLTKTDLVTAYIEDLMTGDDAHKALVALGYDDAEATMYIRLADVRKHAAERKAAEAVQHSLFIARRITRAQASKGLTEAGIKPQRIENLLANWQQELDARTPTLTKAEVGHAVLNELLSPEEGVTRLTRMGYAHADVKIIIALATKGTVIV